MNVVTTVSGQPHRNGRDWPYSTYLLICKLHERGFSPSEMASTVGRSAAQIRSFLDACWLSPVGGYRKLKDQIERDLDAQRVAHGGV